MKISYLEPLSVTCPRCATVGRQRFYGPCSGCVGDLHVLYPGVARVLKTENYIPKMNVTPNAVATKE